MLSPIASWSCLIAAWMAVAWLLLRSRQSRRQLEQLLQAYRDATFRIQRQLAELESQLQAANGRLARLEASQLGTSPSGDESLSPLEVLESLADELSDAASLAKAAHSVVPRARPIPPDPFESDEQILPVARLADQGCSAAEIARRLSKPLGEVELLLSLR